jgi:hypothetical protein
MTPRHHRATHIRASSLGITPRDFSSVNFLLKTYNVPSKMFQTDNELKHHSLCIFLRSSPPFFPPSPSSPYPLFALLCIREYWLNRSFIDDGLQSERERGRGRQLTPWKWNPLQRAAVTNTHTHTPGIITRENGLQKLKQIHGSETRVQSQI